MTQVNTMDYSAVQFPEYTAKITVARYSADEVVQRFISLYDCMSFREQLDELGFGRFQFSRRAKARREYKALCIAMWHLALHKSFPQDADNFYTMFCQTFPEVAGKGKKAVRMQGRVNIYIDLLHSKKDSDFMPVASYFAEVLRLEETDVARLRLKLSLTMRNLYNYIFDKLV